MPATYDEETKRTNEIKTLLDAIDIEGKDVTADALLTQRAIADYLVGRKAHYHFTVKKNQPTLDIKLFFKDRGWLIRFLRTLNPMLSERSPGSPPPAASTL